MGLQLPDRRFKSGCHLTETLVVADFQQCKGFFFLFSHYLSHYGAVLRPVAVEKFFVRLFKQAFVRCLFQDAKQIVLSFEELSEACERVNGQNDTCVKSHREKV